MALADVLQASVVRPCFVGLLDFANDPLRGTTIPGAFAPSGTGDADLDGEIFLETEGPIQISPITQDRGIGGPLTITFSAGEFDNEAVVQQLIQDRRNFLGRKAKLWLFFLNEDESAVLPEFTVLFSGVMVGAESRRQGGNPALISVTCDQDLQKAQTAPVRWIDHQIFHPTDTWSSFINDLSRGPLATATHAGTPMDTGGPTAGAGGGYPNDWMNFPGYFNYPGAPWNQ